jgi:MoxR-like ATPase
MSIPATDPSRSCLTCPSLLQPNEAAVFFRKSVGVPVCARFGKVMGNAETKEPQREKIAKTIARTCSEYGNDRPMSVNWERASFTVMLPDPQVLGAGVTRNSPELVNSCGSCENFVREDIVANQLGWASGLCAAKGKLLLSNRLTFEASGCEYRSFAQNGVRTDVSGLTMLPEYAEGFVPTDDPIRNFFRQQQAGFVDPTDYETDKPVSAEDVANGIRAWRKVEDPATDNVVYLPIFSTEFFSEEEQKKIPRTGDDEHPEDYVDHAFLVYKVAVLWMELDETPGLWGSPGTGKTELFRHLAWLMNMPFERFSITGSSELDDLAGKMHFSKEKGTYWVDGRFTKAWGKPCIIVVDEPNVGPPDVWQFLRPAIDNSKQLVLDMNTGETRSRSLDTYLGMAMNPAWDAKNVGAHMISDADANRLMHLNIQLPPEELEKEIIKTRVKHDGWDIPADKLNTIMKIAEDLRNLCDEDALPITWAIRPQLKVARGIRWFDWLTTYRMASADFLEPDAQERLLDVVRSHIS